MASPGIVRKPQRVAQKRKMSKIWTISCDNSATVLGCQLLLITDRKSYTGLRLVPTSMTLNDLERRNSPFFLFTPNLIALIAKYVTVVEYRPILSVNIASQFQSFTPRVGPGHLSSPLVHLLPHLFPLFTFPFLSLALPIFFFFHPFPFYQNSPTPFPGRRS